MLRGANLALSFSSNISGRHSHGEYGPGVVLKLDHVFCMVTEPATAIGQVEELGWTLDPGQAHEGQGRLFWREQYFELLWITDEAEARANPLRLDRRAAWQTTGASPFGLGFRGRPDPTDGYWLYDALGFPIWVHTDNERFPERPLVFALDLDMERASADAGGDELHEVRVGGPSAPSLPEFEGPAIVHAPGPHSLELVLRPGGVRHRIAAGLVIRA